MAEPHVPDDDPDRDSDPEEAAETIIPGKGPNREEMVSKFLPPEDDWDAKTQLDLNDPARVALIRNYASLMPEVAHMQDTLDSFVTDFEKSRTSVKGVGREQYVSIMKAMFGASDDEDDAASMFAEALGAAADEED